MYHDGTKFNIIPDAGTSQIDINGTVEADSIRSEDGNFIFSPTTDKTTILTGVVNDSLRVEETSLLKGTVTTAADVAVGTKAVVNDSLRVEETSLLKGTVTTAADIAVGTKAVVNDSLRVEETSLLKGTVTTAADIAVGTKAVVNDSLRVEETSLLKGTVTTAADIAVGTKAVMNDSLRVEKTSLLKGTVTTAADIAVGTKAVVNDSLRVEETSLLKGDVTMNANLDIDDSLDVDGVLQVSPVVDSVAINGKLYVSGVTSIGSVSGDSLNLRELTVTDSAYVDTLTSADLNVNGREDISVSGSMVGLSIDGNKTSGNLFQVFNDADGSIGDSSVVINSKGYMGIRLNPSGSYALEVNGNCYGTAWITGSSNYSTNASVGGNISIGQTAGNGYINSFSSTTIGYNTMIVNKNRGSSGIDIDAIDGPDGDIRFGDIGTDGEYVKIDSVGRMDLSYEGIYGRDVSQSDTFSFKMEADTNRWSSENPISINAAAKFWNNVTSGGTIEGATLTESSNAVPNVTDNLSVFAATTSAQLAGVLSDETGSGVAVFGTAPSFTDSITVSKVRTGASSMTLDVTGSGNSYVEIIQDNYAGYLAVGRTSATEPSVISVTDGGTDNAPGFWQMYSDGGTGYWHWTATDGTYRIANAQPADDDAGGYAIIDADDGTIGASGQAVNGSTITGTTFTDGTASLSGGDLTGLDSLNADASKLVFSPTEDSLYTSKLKVDGTATIDDLNGNGGQIYGEIEYDAITFGLDTPSSMSPDTLWFFKNHHAADMTIDSIHVSASTDDQDLSIVSRNWGGGGATLVDAITASIDGTNNYYSTETTISDGTISANQDLGIVKPSAGSTSVEGVIYYHYTKAKR